MVKMDYCAHMKSLLYYIILLLFTLSYFVLFSLIFVVTVPFDRERQILHHASRFWSKMIFRINFAWTMKIEGIDKIDPGKAYVVVVNHQSMLDIPLMYVLPFNFKWVSKREVYKWPIFGAVLWMHGDIAIERGAAASAQKMMHDCGTHIARGTSVIIFPEGTRSRDGRVHRFKEGAFMTAKKLGAPILPCVSEGTGAVMQGWRMKMPHTFTVRVLEPIPADEVAQYSVKEMTARVQAQIASEHAKLRPDLYGEAVG